MLKAIRSNKGFSLVELMIVVAIIGILASVAIPNFQRFQRKARQSEAKNLLSAYYTSEKSFAAEYNQYAGNFYYSGFKPDGSLGYRVQTKLNTTSSPGTLMNLPAATITAENPCVTTQPSAAICPNFDWTEKTYTANTNNIGAFAMAAPAAATGTNFNANAAGYIGTTTPDEWTIDQTMTMANSQSGL